MTKRTSKRKGAPTTDDTSESASNKSVDSVPGRGPIRLVTKKKKISKKRQLQYDVINGVSRVEKVLLQEIKDGDNVKKMNEQEEKSGVAEATDSFLENINTTPPFEKETDMGDEDIFSITAAEEVVASLCEKTDVPTVVFNEEDCVANNTKKNKKVVFNEKQELPSPVVNTEFEKNENIVTPFDITRFTSNNEMYIPTLVGIYGTVKPKSTPSFFIAQTGGLGRDFAVPSHAVAKTLTKLDFEKEKKVTLFVLWKGFFYPAYNIKRYMVTKSFDHFIKELLKYSDTNSPDRASVLHYCEDIHPGCASPHTVFSCIGNGPDEKKESEKKHKEYFSKVYRDWKGEASVFSTLENDKVLQIF